jgi:hypothetical protein
VLQAFDKPIITSITKAVIITKAAHFKIGPCQWSSIHIGMEVAICLEIG